MKILVNQTYTPAVFHRYVICAGQGAGFSGHWAPVVLPQCLGPDPRLGSDRLTFRLRAISRWVDEEHRILVPSSDLVKEQSGVWRVTR